MRILLHDPSPLPHSAWTHLFLPNASPMDPHELLSLVYYFEAPLQQVTWHNSARDKGPRQLGSELPTSYRMIPTKASNNGDNVRDRHNSNLTI